MTSQTVAVAPEVATCRVMVAPVVEDSASAPLPAEIVYTKRAVNPFFNTGLESWLHRNDVDTVVLCGVYTHMVVDSSARYADDAGFHVTVLEDCCASPDPELHRIECEKILPLFGEVTSSAAFLAGLRQP